MPAYLVGISILYLAQKAALLISHIAYRSIIQPSLVMLRNEASHSKNDRMIIEDKMLRSSA
jgi:hypothetical protein